jgi:FdhD protein
MPQAYAIPAPDRWPLYVLAGGQSSRFGADKALALLDDKPLIVHAIAAFSGIAAQHIAVVDHASRLLGVDLPVVVDAVPHAGPAQGLLTALQHRGQGWLWLAPCDVLGVKPEWLQDLAAQAQPGMRALAWRNDRWQPLPSLWHTDALPLVQKAMAGGADALWQLLDAVHARAVPLPADWTDVRRIDTQDALRRLQRERVSVAKREVVQVRGATVTRTLDALAVEAPLMMELVQGERSRNLGVTLRTPGDDVELAVGLAFSDEALLQHSDLARAEATADAVTLHLAPSAPPPIDTNPRVRVTNAACGACGKSELDVLRVVSRVQSEALRVPLALLQSLPQVLRAHQAAFAATGGLHAAGLFSPQGALLDLREDVGRHNALDKLLGAAFLAGHLPLHDHIVLLSGRAAYELLQKAALAGVPIVAAVGAPSSLAVAVAERARITLVGFVSADRANVYTHPERLLFP